MMSVDLKVPELVWRFTSIPRYSWSIESIRVKYQNLMDARMTLVVSVVFVELWYLYSIYSWVRKSLRVFLKNICYIPLDGVRD
jgi:hypothetical protein